MNFFAFSTPRDLLEKGRRDLERMKADLNSDTIFNCFVTLWHVRDYVAIAKAKTEKDIRPLLKGIRTELFKHIEFKYCSFLANGGKHLKLNDKDVEMFKAKYQTGAFQSGAFQSDAFQVEGYFIVEGTKIRVRHLIPLAQDIIELWEKYLTNEKL